MKPVHFPLVLIIALSLPFQLTAQSRDAVERSIANLREEVVFRRMLDHDQKVVDGSPYLSDDFTHGTITYKDGRTFTDIPIRLNIYINELEFRSNDKIYALANNLAVEKVLIGEDTFVYEKFENKKITQYAYFRQLVNGKTDLLVKANVEYLNPQPSQGVVSSKPARFDRRSDAYYLKMEDDYLEKIGSVKKLVKKLGNHKDEMAKYVNTSGISSRNEVELIQFVQYYNELL